MHYRSRPVAELPDRFYPDPKIRVFHTYGGWVSVLTAIAMCCFAFSTILGWGLYGNLIALFLLSGTVLKLVKQNEQKHKK